MLDINKTIKIIIYFIKKKGINHTSIEAERLINLISLAESLTLKIPHRSLLGDKTALNEINDLIMGKKFILEWDIFFTIVNSSGYSWKNSRLIYLHKDIDSFCDTFFNQLDSFDLQILDYIHDIYHEKSNEEVHKAYLSVNKKRPSYNTITI